MPFLPATRLLTALVLSLSFALAPLPASAVEALQIETRDGQIRVTARQVELRELLQSLAEHAQFKLWISRDLPAQAVSADIEMMPVADALGRLLAANSFALVYGADGAVSALYLVPTGEEQPIRTTLNSESPDVGEQVLQNALASEALPDHIKAALLSQHYSQSREFRESVAAQRPAAIRQLIDSLRQLGSPSAATLQRLERLQREANQPDEKRDE